MKLIRIFLVVVVALLAISAMTACSKDSTAPKSDTKSKSSDGGSGSGSGDGSGGGKVIEVALSEFKVTPDEFSVDKGQKVTFKVTNDGTFGHNFSVPDLNKIIDLDAGQTGELKMTFDEAGTFNIVCTVDAHESKGMTGKIVVK